MSEAPPDRDEEMLARLAELDLAAAERVHGRLMAAEAVAEIAELGRTYQRIARSLRQTLALKAKLKRDRETAAKQSADIAQPPPRPAPTGPMAMARRARELRDAVGRVIWDEAEDADSATFMEEMLDELIAHHIRRDGFCADALDEHVIQVCLDLGLSPDKAERWRDLPEPPDDEQNLADDPDRQSSA